MPTEHTFSEDTCDMNRLHNQLNAVVAHLGFDLQQALDFFRPSGTAQQVAHSRRGCR